MAKTIKVARIVELTNAFFEKSPDDARMERLHAQAFVTNLLMETGNYAGFGYITPYGEPGSDSSRIFFYKSHKL
jgi:hypothetical protein